MRDRESGDTWFYNKRTGVSQWEKPDELDGQLSKSANVKRLPPFSSAAARLGTTHPFILMPPTLPYVSTLIAGGGVPFFPNLLYPLLPPNNPY